jgi:hypothetical protein
MPIEVVCQCGRSFRAKEEHAGLRAKCPNCGLVIEIPKPASDPPPLPREVSVGSLRGGLEEDRLGVDREATLTDVWKVLNTISSQTGATSQRSASDGDRPHEYKVITQKDKWFSGKFDPEKVEGALNSYAQQGWTLKGVATASVPSFGGQRDEIVIIMER